VGGGTRAVVRRGVLGMVSLGREEIRYGYLRGRYQTMMACGHRNHSED